MSSGFVSGGTVEDPTERSAEWLAAQKEIEAKRQRELDEQAQISARKSLYDTLKANQAAKQEAFEEANKLKNQFRPLDADEAEYLDSLLEGTKRDEERVKRETAEGLKQFRQQQEEADKRARAETGKDETQDAGEEENWSVGKKRRRAKEKEGLKGVNIRRLSTMEDKGKPVDSDAPTIPTKPPTKAVKSRKEISTTTKDVSGASLEKSKVPVPAKSSLVAYGSDSEDE